jgi:2-polyprenyl-6-methoxyphenol hydroxylase-like FAD-dependent oxidoreductase
MPRDKTWDILVVGAGPGGLASALELDRVLNGAGSGGLRQSRITVVDPLNPITQFDSGKGFAYSITENGYRLLDRHPAVLELLTERGVEGGVSEVRIFEPDGANSTSKIVRRTPGQRANWYTARNELIEILDDGLRDAQGAGRVSIRSGWELDRLEREPGAVRATIRNRLTGEAIEMQPRLVVGSDGMGSFVRKSLYDWAAEDGAPAHRNPFSMRVFHSVSGWLRFKVLPLNNNFRLRAPAAVQAGAAVGAPAAREPASEHVVAAEPFYTIKSAQENPAQTEAMSLGLSPSSPATVFRPLLIGKTDDHRIWRDPALQSAEGLRAWFAELFPQVDWDSAVAPDAWARFVDARGGRFAHPQVTRGAAAMLVPPAAGGAGAAVLLLGDSLKAAPPNLGTGVNSVSRRVLTSLCHSLLRGLMLTCGVCTVSRRSARPRSSPTTSRRGWSGARETPRRPRR